MELVYLPAISPDAIENRWVVNPTHWMDARLKGTEAYHPFALVAFPTWSRVRYAFEPNEFIFGDSGGYSVGSQGLVLDPCEVIQWQVRRCTVGAVLDTPPFGDDKRKLSVGLHVGLQRTVAAVKSALPIYLAALDAGRGFRWWGVVHGRTIEQLQRWWDDVSRIYPFHEEGEGWCFKPHPLNSSESIAGCLQFASERGIRRAHFFGASGTATVEALRYLGPQYGLDLVTFDSTVPLLSARNRLTHYPGGWLRGGWQWEQVASNCPCQSCQFMRVDFVEDPGLLHENSYVQQRLAFHNVLGMLDGFRQIHDRYERQGMAKQSAGSNGKEDATCALMAPQVTF